MRGLYYRAAPARSGEYDRIPSYNARQHKKNFGKLQKTAEELIEQNQYCREGFWVLKFDIDIKGYFLRGECNDLASAEDRKRFPDTIALW